jgi:hypothetical protein
MPKSLRSEGIHSQQYQCLRVDLQHSHTYATSSNASQSCIIANEADRILVKTHTLVGIILSLMEVWWIPHDLCLYELAAFVCQKMLDRK